MSRNSSTHELLNFLVVAKDGNVGYLDDFYIDDEYWVIRYIMVESGDWLHRKDVVIATQMIERVDLSSRRIFLNTIREQVESSPHIHRGRVISREQETEYYDHFKWNYYWSEQNPISNLHTRKEVIGMGIHTPESTFGRISDVLFSTIKWTVEHLILHAHRVLDGKVVLISTKDVVSVDRINHRVNVKLLEGQVQEAPEWKG
ncbi:MAG: PRC-barrel domain-containing protein [Bdellovibrionia bacterium]